MLSARQRSAFIMFDGVKSIEQVLTASVGLGIARSDVDQMVANGLLVEAATSAHNSGPVAASLPVSASAQPAVGVEARTSRSEPQPVGQRTNQERYAQAWPLATKLTAAMGIRGFRLNLAIEAAGGYDDLLALLPKIQAAVGPEKAADFERALKS